ncbi:MAG: hypothetical protein IJG68_00160 [Bacilli bacterium]|nr:hypothetical protein [Bacilli bacterium]
MKIENIKSLEYFYTTGYYINADVRYNIECEKSCILKIKPQGKSNEEQEEYELSEETLKQIEDLLNKYQVSEWDGFNKTDSRVLDGNSFHFYVTYEDGKSISASGYMSYPKNYGIVTKELERILKEQMK